MGDLGFALSLLDSFTSNCGTRIKEIFDNVRTANVAGVGEAAHILKGTAGIVATNRLSSIAARIELAGKTNDPLSIESSLGELMDEVKFCCEFIRDYKQTTATQSSIESSK